METIFIIYLVIAAAFGLFMSAMTGQTGPGAMSFWIILSMLVLPIVLIYAIVAYALENRL